jgi:endonuclease III
MADLQINWSEYFDPIIKMYGKRKHPLDYKNRYQLVVMVILSAQDSDKHINQIAETFFPAYPNMESLARVTAMDLHRYLGSVRNFDNKSKWLIKLAQTVGDDSHIPTILEELTQLPGIGRKSANVIIRESGGKAEGIIVDLHVVRVAPRLGVVTSDKPDKIEKELMATVPQEKWNDLGMAISFLGREICRPTPKCEICPMKNVCKYYKENVS